MLLFNTQCERTANQAQSNYKYMAHLIGTTFIALSYTMYFF